MWSPSHAETLCYMQAPTGMMPGPTRYAISRIHNVASSFDLFFTPDLIQLILQMTNLYGRHSVSGWSDVDAQEIRAYMRLLILTAPLTSSTRRRGVCWLCRGMKKRSSTTKCAFVGNTRSQAAGPHTSYIQCLDISVYIFHILFVFHMFYFGFCCLNFQSCCSFHNKSSY